MKKTYIAPKSVEYNISVEANLLQNMSVIDDSVDGDKALGKEEKSSSSGIWDLY